LGRKESRTVNLREKRRKNFVRSKREGKATVVVY